MHILCDTLGSGVWFFLIVHVFVISEDGRDACARRLTVWIANCCGVRKLTRAPRFSAMCIQSSNFWRHSLFHRSIVECKEDFLIENVLFLDPWKIIVLLEANVNGG